MPKHATWDGPREMRCYGPSDEQFTAWAEFAVGGDNRWTFTGTGPEVRAWTIKARQIGATRVGYAAA